METHFIEASHTITGAGNWGRFMIARYEQEEWDRRSVLDPVHPRTLYTAGHSKEVCVVFDLVTGEGAMFVPGGLASADLHKRRIWVCPLFEPFLAWLWQWYRQHKDNWFDILPQAVALPDAPFETHGYRRPGLVLENQEEIYRDRGYVGGLEPLDSVGP